MEESILQAFGIYMTNAANSLKAGKLHILFISYFTLTIHVLATHILVRYLSPPRFYQKNVALNLLLHLQHFVESQPIAYCKWNFRYWNRTHSGGPTRDTTVNCGTSTTTAQTWYRLSEGSRVSWNTPCSRGRTSRPGKVSSGKWNFLSSWLLFVWFEVLRTSQQY